MCNPTMNLYIVTKNIYITGGSLITKQGELDIGVEFEHNGLTNIISAKVLLNLNNTSK